MNLPFQRLGAWIALILAVTGSGFAQEAPRILTIEIDRVVHPLTAEIKVDGEWKAIGNIGLMGFGTVNHNAEIGIVIGEKDYWNQGYGTEMMELMTSKSEMYPKTPTALAKMAQRLMIG